MITKYIVKEWEDVHSEVIFFFSLNPLVVQPCT